MSMLLSDLGSALVAKIKNTQDCAVLTRSRYESPLMLKSGSAFRVEHNTSCSKRAIMKLMSVMMKKITVYNGDTEQNHSPAVMMFFRSSCHYLPYYSSTVHFLWVPSGGSGRRLEGMVLTPVYAVFTRSF